MWLQQENLEFTKPNWVLRKSKLYYRPILGYYAWESKRKIMWTFRKRRSKILSCFYSSFSIFLVLLLIMLVITIYLFQSFFFYFLRMSWMYTMEYYDSCLFLHIVLPINNSSSQILFFCSVLCCFNNSLSLTSAVYMTWVWRYLITHGKPTNDNILNI